MKKFSIPNISIPNISIPNVSGNVDVGSIKSAINSAIPDISKLKNSLDLKNTASNILSEVMNGETPDVSNLTNGLNLESVASNMLSEAMNGEIDLPPELNGFLK